MLLIAMLIAQATPTAENDVVVTARKLQHMAIVLKRRRGTYYCTLKRPSGDPVLDDAACSAAARCHRTSATRDALRTCVIADLTPLISRRDEPK